MKIKKKQLCQLTGISPATLRYYVDEKIIIPEQDSSNGYNYYSYEDALLLLRMRELRSLGFSLEDAASILRHANTPDQHVALLREKRLQLIEERRILDEKIQVLDLRCQSEHSRRDGVYIYYAASPTYSAFFDEKHNSTNAVRELNSLLPASRLTLQIIPGTTGFRPGLTITAQRYEYLNKTNHYGIGLEKLSQERILMNKTIPDLRTVSADDFVPVFEYAHQHHFTVTSNIFCIVRQVFIVNGRIGCDVLGGVCYTD